MDGATLNELERQLRRSAMDAKGLASSAKRKKYAEYTYDSVCREFATLAENDVFVLEFLTNRIINGLEGMPVIEHDGFLDAFFRINPQRALPETKDYISKILRSEIGKTSLADKFKKYRRKLPYGIFSKKSAVKPKRSEPYKLTPYEHKCCDELYELNIRQIRELERLRQAMREWGHEPSYYKNMEKEFVKDIKDIFLAEEKKECPEYKNMTCAELEKELAKMKKQRSSFELLISDFYDDEEFREETKKAVLERAIEEVKIFGDGQKKRCPNLIGEF